MRVGGKWKVEDVEVVGLNYVLVMESFLNLGELQNRSYTQCRCSILRKKLL